MPVNDFGDLHDDPQLAARGHFEPHTNPFLGAGLYERNGFPDAVRFFWSLHGVALTRSPSVHTDGFAPNLDDAKAQFQKSWDAWKAWAKLEEVE